jgi:MFS family permease
MPDTARLPASGSGWANLLSGRNASRTLVLGGGVALHAIDLYIATTMMPSVIRDIGGLEYYAWSTALFVVASILGSALSARLLQRLGPRGAYGAAALVFGMGALLCGAAPSMPVLLGGRFVQGFGAGFLLALAYAMIRIVFAEALWPRAMALLSGMWGAATLVGPAIGGGFAQMNAWRWAFGSLLPVTVVFALLAGSRLPKRSSERERGSSLAVPQLLLLGGAVVAVSAGSISDDVVWNGIGVGVAIFLTVLLVRVEAGASRRLLPRGAFRLAAPLGALFLTMSLLAITVTSSEVFLPLFLQTLHGSTPLVAGYLGALMAGGWTIGSLSSSGWTERGVRHAIMLSPILAFVGMALLALLVPHRSGGDWRSFGPICLALVVVGLGVGLAWPHLLTRVLQVAGGEGGEQDLASSALTTVQLFATALGAALAGWSRISAASPGRAVRRASPARRARCLSCSRLRRLAASSSRVVSCVLMLLDSTVDGAEKASSIAPREGGRRLLPDDSVAGPPAPCRAG